VRTCDLRIASGSTAVHSDMFVWNEKESTEDAALQILNILFAVPQLSVKLDSITDEQFQMAKFWMTYWKQNREILLDGDFIPQRPDQLYPIIRSSLHQKSIVALYSQQLVILDDNTITQLDLINASGKDELTVNLKYSPGNCSVKVKNCLGEIVNSYTKELNMGLHTFQCPSSGLIEIVKK